MKTSFKYSPDLSQKAPRDPVLPTSPHLLHHTSPNPTYTVPHPLAAATQLFIEPLPLLRATLHTFPQFAMQNAQADMVAQRAPVPSEQQSDQTSTGRITSANETNDSCSSTSMSISEGSNSGDAMPMIDGFAFFSLALHDHLKSKMCTAAAASGAEKISKQDSTKAMISNELVVNELRRLWKEMGETQKQEWQSQAVSIATTNFDSSSQHEDEDNDSQDSGTSSFASKQSTERRSNASEERRSDPGTHACPSQEGIEVRERERKSESRERERKSESRKQQERKSESRPPGQKEQRQNKERRKERRIELRRERPSTESREERRESAQGASSSHHATNLPKQQPAAAESARQEHPQMASNSSPVLPSSSIPHNFSSPQANMTGLDQHALTQLMLANLQAQNGAGMTSMHNNASLLGRDPRYFHQGASMHAAMPAQNLQAQNVAQLLLHNNLMMLGGLPSNSSLMAQQVDPSQAHMNQMMHQLGNQNNIYVNSTPRFGLPMQNSNLLNSYLSSAAGLQPQQNPYFGISDGLMGAQLGLSPGMLQSGAGGVGGWNTSSPEEAAGRAGGGKRKHEQVQPSGITLEPEPPQVRTMTFVCDLLSPHEGQVDLEILAEDCTIVACAPGIVGLSCQLQTAEGTRVVKRGQVKDARRHFAHQAQLRLSLPNSPNISLKVFSTGRLQIAGCRDEESCMEAVQLVAHAVNEIQTRRPDVMKRQVKVEGTLVEGPINPKDLPSPQIVMINCSFDSGMAAVGSALNPHRLTELLYEMQRNSKAVEEVSYNPEQRYTGVKVKFKPNVDLVGDEDAVTRDREVFIGMFPSGKAVITGAVRWEEVERSYDFTKSVLCGHFDYLRVPVEDLGGGRSCRKKARNKPAF